MYKKYSVKLSQSPNQGVEIVYLAIPNECPLCHKGIEPNEISKKFNCESHLLSVFWECPACNKTFLSHAYNPSNTGEFPSQSKCYPILPQKHKFNENISELSNNFVDIYNQAVEAESYNLNQICGIGYRKALEFLIKDFCIHCYQDAKDKIQKATLSQVINTYIDNDKIKTLAKVSSWLGNDETHYVKVFTDQDINDLKKFIEATAHFISFELISEEANKVVEASSKS